MKSAAWTSTLILLASLVASVPALSQGQPPRSKDAAIRDLLDLTGSSKLGVQAMNQMISAFKQGAPEVEDKFWERFAAKVDPNELTELVVPVYDKHFSIQELKEIIAFHKTPIGRKLIATMPLILGESMAAGQDWGRRLGERAMKEIQAEKSDAKK